MTNRVVLTGIGVISPIGNGREAFWQALVDGKNGIERITRFDASECASQIAGEVKDFKPEDYIEADPDNQIGCILFADLLDDAIASFTTLGLTNDSLEKGSTYKYKKGVTDSAPGDNNLTINMTTMAYSTLK